MLTELHQTGDGRRDFFPNPGLLGQIEILGRREGGLIEASVPIGLIYREDVPVDEPHVRELADQIREEKKKGGTGQLSPILVGHVPDFNMFPIIDGFHRVPALELNGEQDIFATIRPTSSWAELTDLRISAANSHKSIRFARLLEWAEDAWSRSPWAERIKINQAFALKTSSLTTGVRMGLSPDEATEIRDWIDRKCALWKMAPGTLYQHLITAQTAAPELVKEARERKGGRTLEALTPLHLREITMIYPNNYEMQRIVAQVAKDQALSVHTTKALSVALARARNPEQIRQIIEGGRWKDVRPARQSYHRPPAHETQRERAASNDLLDKFFQAELKIAELTIENAQLTGRYYLQEKDPQNNGVDLQAGVQELVSVDDEPTEATIITLNDSQINSIVERMYGLQTRVQRTLSRRFGVSFEDIEDILSEVILKTLTAIKKGKFEYKDEGNLEAWTMMLAKNEAIVKHRRDRKLLSLDEVDDDLTTLVDHIEDNKATQAFEQVDMDDEYKELIKKSLPYIPDEQRRIFILRQFFELPFIDIAQITGKSLNNTKVLIFKAKERVARLIEEGTVIV